MFLIVAALYCEAKPLITYFKLKRDTTIDRCEIYCSEDICVIISGTGIIHSAASTAFLIASRNGNGIAGILNMGICGALPVNTELGSPIIFNKIVNTTSGKVFYPDMFLSSGIAEGTLHSFSHRISKEKCIGDIKFVDMEAAGFMEASLMYLPPHKIYCLKVISDHLDVEKLETTNVSNIIRQNLPIIENLIKDSTGFEDSKALRLTDKDIDLLNDMSLGLKLSTTMKYQLKELFLQYLIHTGNNLSLALEKYKGMEVKSKNEGKIILNELRGVLTGE